MKLLFVCSGNTCRSPLAWAAWQKVARENEDSLAFVEVETAGLNARAGTRASEMARRVAASWKVDLSAHRARAGNLGRADWIVTMTGEQAAQIAFRLGNPFNAATAQGRKPRIVTLGSYAPHTSEGAWMDALLGNVPDDATRDDILDPFGGSFEAYQECGARILRAVAALARELKGTSE